MNKRDSDRIREISPAYGTKAHSLTYEDYLRMPAGLRYELVEGEIQMVPTPSVRHQEVSVNIERALYWARDNDLGKVYHAPLEVLLDERVVVQPDILLISKSRLGIVKGPHVSGAPDLVDTVSHNGGPGPHHETPHLLPVRGSRILGSRH